MLAGQKQRLIRAVLGLLALLATATPLLAQTPGVVEAAALPDPAEPGPYAVGVTTRMFQRTSSANGQQRNLLTYIWYPATGQAAINPTFEATVNAPPSSGAGPYPVVTWSHGYTGSPTSYHYFIAHLASYGFVVVAPNHRGPTQPGPSCPGACTDQDGTPDDWAIDRPDDLSYVLDQALALSAGGDPILGGLLDATRVGGAGHSFGGWTALALMAAKHPYLAAVAMAPGAPGTLGPTLPTIAAGATEPVMILAGSLDSQVRLPYVQAAFGSLPSNSEHWLLTLQRAGHMSFMNRCVPGGLIGISCAQGMPDDQAHTLIERWATAFLLEWVAGDGRYGPYLDGQRAANDPGLTVQVAGR